MEERLSSETVRGSALALALGILAAILWLWLAAGKFHHWDFWSWLIGGSWLALIGVQVWQTVVYYEIILTSTTLNCARLFARPVEYSVADFTALHQTNLPNRPLRMCFRDGKTFLFSPKLKVSHFSIYSLSRADFTAYWAEGIADRAAALAGPESPPRKIPPASFSE